MTDLDLTPTYELLAKLQGEIKRIEAETAERVAHYDDKEYAREEWRKFDLMIAPMLREIEGVTKILADYWGRQPMPPVLIHGQPVAGGKE